MWVIEPNDMEQPPQPTARLERLKWLAAIGLAVLVACSGCGFFFTVGLVARGELTANVLGTDLRLWAIREKRETGLGFDRSFETQQADRVCVQHNVILLLWKPTLSIDNLSYNDCS